MGYANRSIKLDFPELATEGDEIWVAIRNPKYLTPGEVRASRKGAKAGGAEGDDEDEYTSFALFAKMIIGWHVYDAASNDDNPPQLGMPATPDLISKLPLEILNRLGEELSKVNPQKPTEPQEATTSS